MVTERFRSIGVPPSSPKCWNAVHPVFPLNLSTDYNFVYVMTLMM